MPNSGAAARAASNYRIRTDGRRVRLPGDQNSNIYRRPDGKLEIGYRDSLGKQRWKVVRGGITAARAEHKRVSVTSLCIASGVPPTTALRWIAQMSEAGLLERVEDEADRRRVEEVVQRVDNVRSVVNELTIGQPSTFQDRSNDVFISGKIKVVDYMAANSCK